MPSVSEARRRKILVTGGSGMLGRAVVKRLGKQSDVTGVSRSGKDGSEACDLSDPEAVRRCFEKRPYEWVVHTAAYSDVDGCERNPALAHASNALATKYLAENCGKRRIPFVYVSTDYVFDGKKNSRYEIHDPVCPVNIYGLTKLEGEFFAREYAPVSAVVRTSWLFGRGNPNNFVNAILDRLSREKIVRVLDDQEDSPTFVEDLAEALENIGATLLAFAEKNPEAALHEIFQVCNAGSTTRLGMTLAIKEWLRLKDVRVERLDKSEIPNRPALRPRYAVMSTAHYEEVFKTRLRPWEESLKAYLDEAVLCAS